MTIAFMGARLIDGNGGTPLENATVIVDGTKIVDITTQRRVGSDVQVLDVAGKTIMPGLIDSHLHFGPFFQWVISSQHRSLGYLFSIVIRHMRQALETGVTTARDMGGLEAGICQAQADGLIVGPRTQTAIVIINATNGLIDSRSGLIPAVTPQGLYQILPGLPAGWADGVDGVRAKVREALRYGADSIKLANTACPWGNPKVRPDRPLFTRAELEAAVDEAHRAGVPVTCHVVTWDNTEAALDAIRAGVDLIDHGNYLDDECIEEMAKRGTWYCPMFFVLDYHRARNPNLAVRPWAERTFQQTGESFRKALKAGVRICMGTDQGYESGVQGFEMVQMVKNGMTPMQAIVASTKSSAEAMRMDRLVGTLEEGKEADLLVLDRDPLDDISVLMDPANLRLVMQAGKPISGSMTREFPYRASENLDFMSAMLTGELKKRSW